MGIFEIDSYIERAKKLIAMNDEQSLFYACLEMRYCFEVIAYKQLQLYGDKIPGLLASKWQPDQIIRTLASFDQDSDQTAQLSISITRIPDTSELQPNAPEARSAFESIDYLPLGETKRFKWKEFRSIYNKLGSHLHLGKDLRHNEPSQSGLEDILLKLEEVASSKMMFAKHDIATAVCICGEILVLGPKERSGETSIACRNTKCNRLWAADGRPNSITVVGQVLLNCSCGAMVPFAPECVFRPVLCPNCKGTVTVSAIKTTTESRP